MLQTQFANPLEKAEKKLYYGEASLELSLLFKGGQRPTSKGQTRRETRAQSHGSVRDASTDRQTAEGFILWQFFIIITLIAYSPEILFIWRIIDL